MAHNQRHSGPSNLRTMKYATVEDIIASFPRPVLPSQYQGNRTIIPYMPSPKCYKQMHAQLTPI
jgi:hypothetical protein